MQEIDELVERLYKEQLETVAEQKHDPELRIRFIEYMKRYEKFADNLNAYPQFAQQTIERWYQRELRIWGRLSADRKYGYFTPDEAFLEVDRCSASLSAMAKKRLQHGDSELADEDVVHSLVERMRVALPNVREDNVPMAKRQFSEGMVDGNYACGKSNHMSLRLADRARYIVK